MDIGDFIPVQVILGFIVKYAEQAKESKPVHILCSGSYLGFLPWLTSAMGGDGETETGNTLSSPCHSSHCSITTTEKSTRTTALIFFPVVFCSFFSRGQTQDTVCRRPCTRCWAKALDDRVDMVTIQPDQLIFPPIPLLSLVGWTAGQYLAMLS